MTATTTPVLSREVRKELAEAIAFGNLGATSPRAQAELRAACAPHLDLAGLGRVWDRYEWARKVVLDLELDGGMWAVYWPELTCPNRADEARRLAAGLLAEAEHELLGGN